MVRTIYKDMDRLKDMLINFMNGKVEKILHFKIDIGIYDCLYYLCIMNNSLRIESFWIVEKIYFL